MKIKRLILSILPLLGLILNPLSPLLLSIGMLSTPAEVAHAAAATQPVVAIHVSELTQDLETRAAVPPTPPDTGFEWWYASWHYAVIYESLKIAFESDGTPYVIVTDADIAAGQLMDGAAPKYPIVFSLASEAIADNEIQPLLDYVNAGGFLFSGSSAFTRNPDGTTRGNFAIASALGLNMVTSTLQNWTLNSSFTHLTDHRLVSHIPTGTVTWDMLTAAEDIVWGSTGAQYLWRTVSTGAEVIATGSGLPLIATHEYGAGRFIYHAIFNPIVGAGGYDSGMYAYTIYRNAVEWAFEAANLPIVKRSPWPFGYDAAFMVRHDFENYLGNLNGIVEASAAYEQSIGVKGDYYFCTGILREYGGDKSPYIESLRRAITLYGATIGSHNGGYPNIGTTPPDDGSYGYWHWGPDTMLDLTGGFPAPYNTYTSGYDYSKDSIQISFEDLEGWFAGIDNGRSGCGATADCPRTWVAPYFNSGRDRSLKILAELNAVVMGEQKVSPFPHWTLSYDPATPNHRYPVVTLAPSDWYVGSSISQSIEGHNTQSIQALVDFYTRQGYLINLYGHGASTSGNTKTYVDYAAAKPSIWAANAVSLYDWWVRRDPMVVTPVYTQSGRTATVSAVISGTVDPEAAVELVIPNWDSGAIGNLEVRLDGILAAPGEYRSTNYGVKVRVGTAIHNVEVSYTPLEGWVQTDWSGGPGQPIWSDETRYNSASGINSNNPGQFSLNLISDGVPLFADDFNRAGDPPPEPVPFTWITAGIPGNNALFDTTGGTLNTSLSTASQYGYAYKETPPQPAGDYTLEMDIRFLASMGPGGGGIFGRLDPATGGRYAVWIYPGTSVLRLIRFTNWSAWTGLGDVTIPAVGTGWHHLKLVFNGSSIQVFYDHSETPTHNVTDTSYSAGYGGLDFWGSTTSGPGYNNYVVSDNLGSVLFSDDFGVDPVLPDLLPPWMVYTGGWAVTDMALRSTTSGLGGYANIYYSTAEPWTDYSVQARIQFPSGAFGGGLAGRLNPATGTRYTAWVYPGSSTLKLLEWSDWDSWTEISSTNIPAVASDWHSVRMDFSGSHILVYWDGSLLIDANDATAPYLSGGIGFDTYTASSPYLIAAEDVEVRGPAQHESSGSLTSSAFDGGVGAAWYTIRWNASTPDSTSLCIRTRTADRADLLSAEGWSDCYPASGADVSSPDRRWIQYQIELGTSNPTVTPVFFENGITYSPGIYIPASYLSELTPLSGDSLSSPVLSARLMDEGSSPIPGRTIRFTLDGLSPVEGITGADGTATAVVDLNIAPGIYPMTAAFASDGMYGPSTVEAAFTVTNPWFEWIQDSAAEFGSGTLEGTDATSQPGSVILLSQILGEEEEYGPFELGAQTWNYRHRLYIQNPNPGPIPVGYTLGLQLNTAALVTAGKLLANGNDLRLVWTGAGGPLELDRAADTAFNTPSTQIWFRSQAAIPANSRDTSYYIYYGNPTAGEPPANLANVFLWFDDFNDDQINPALWSQTGTVSEFNGRAHLSPGGGLISLNSLAYGMLEMRINAVGEDNYMWWGWEDGIADASNFMVFEEFPAPANFAALLRSDGGVYQNLPVTQPAGGLTVPHTYAAEWRPGQARWYVDGMPVQSATTGIPDTPMRANFYANQQAFRIDWMRARLLAPVDPQVSLAAPYLGFISPGTYTSIAFDTGGNSSWYFLVWDALTPEGSGITLKLRSGNTLTELENAEWIDYPASGLRISNPEGRWIQYQAVLTTADPFITPELQRVVIYYYPHNQPPTATDDAYTTAESQNLSVAPPGVLGNDSDPDGDSLSASRVADPAHGTLLLNADGSFSYTPAAGFRGEDSFSYLANDGQSNSNTATVRITVSQTNHPPEADAQSVTTNEDTPLAITLTGTDIDGDSLTYSVIDDPAHGTLSSDAPNLTYTPSANYNGPDSFSFTVSDGTLTSPSAEVSITVNPVNDVPEADAQSVATNEDTPLAITLTGTDIDGDSLTYSVIGDPAHGTLSGDAPSLVYTPTTNYNGPDSFSFTVSDGELTSSAAEVSITVNPVNDAPSAANDSYATQEDTPLEIIDPAAGVLANDQDIDLDALAAVLESSPAHGTLTLNSAGTFVYTPASGYTGSDTFTYRATDGELVSAPATVTISVTPVNHAPVAVDDAYTVAEDSLLTIPAEAGVLSNDTDRDGDDLSASLVDGPAHGTLQLDSSGGLIYTPAADFNGQDSFTYRAFDGLAYSAPAAVTITIQEVSENVYLPVLAH